MEKVFKWFLDVLVLSQPIFDIGAKSFVSGLVMANVTGMGIFIETVAAVVFVMWIISGVPRVVRDLYRDGTEVKEG